MSRTSLVGLKIAIMVASGFDQQHFVDIQKMLLLQNAKLKVLAPIAGLVHGRCADEKGMSYPVDAQFSETLAIDYDALILPSGTHHLPTLKDELHATRIIRAFLRESMPVLVQGQTIEVVSELDNRIDAQKILAAGDHFSQGNLLWVHDDMRPSDIARKFLVVCNRYESDNSAAA